MSQQIRAIVEQTWRNHIGLPADWTPAQTEEFLTSQTTTICAEIDRRTTDMQAQTLRQWMSDHRREPDYLTKAGLLNNLRQMITEQVLTEALYEKIPPEADETLEPETLSGTADLPVEAADRWRYPVARTAEVDPDLDELADRLLPHRSTLVRVMAAHLLQAMREDGQPLPTSPGDPALAPFTNQLEQGMQADNQPLDGPGALVAP